MTGIVSRSPWRGIGWRKPGGRRLRQARTTEESLRRSDSESASIVLDLRDILAPSTKQVRGENGIELVEQVPAALREPHITRAPIVGILALFDKAHPSFPAIALAEQFELPRNRRVFLIREVLHKIGHRDQRTLVRRRHADGKQSRKHAQRHVGIAALNKFQRAGEPLELGAVQRFTGAEKKEEH